MSLLDNGPHSIVVYPAIVSTDSRGNVRSKPSNVGVTVTGVLVSPVRSERLQSDGGGIRAEWRVSGRTMPLGPWSRVSWSGRYLSVVDGPREHTASPNTRHVTAILREER